MKQAIMRAASLLLILVAVNGAVARAEELTAFIGATVIDGTGMPPIPGGVILVEGERITAVGHSDQITIPAQARVIDAQGKWIIPGLIDAHVHFFQSGGIYTRPDVIDLRSARPYPEEIAWIRQRIPHTLARYLASGVTSVVDMGGPMWTFEVRELASQSLLAPRVALAGPLISNFRPRELETEQPPIIKVDSSAEARSAVRRVLNHQPDLLKLWLIWLPSQLLVAKADWVQSAIEESHASGIRVAVHATQREMARAAVQAGADILVHSIEDRPVDQALIRLLKERDIPYITTLMVKEGYREVLGQQVELSDIERHIGDPEVIATFDDLAKLRPWSWLKRLVSPFSINSVMIDNLKRLQESDITIAAGTDAGNIGTLHGPALHREMELMAEAGLSPMEVLVAATQGGAKVMGRESELGTIEKGKLADLVLLDANPLQDIRNTRRIYRVVKGGVILDPEQIIKDLEEGSEPSVPR